MRIDLEFVELHSPLFIDGTNFGLKLYSDPKKCKAPIELWYDTDLRHTIVLYKNKVSLIESTASMTLTKPSQIGIELTPALTKPHAIIPIAAEDRIVRAQATGPEKTIRTAQVSDPTREAPKTIIRRPKFQGQESQGE